MSYTISYNVCIYVSYVCVYIHIYIYVQTGLLGTLIGPKSPYSRSRNCGLLTGGARFLRRAFRVESLENREAPLALRSIILTSPPAMLRARDRSIVIGRNGCMKACEVA